MRKYGDELFIYAMVLQQSNVNAEEDKERNEKQDEDIFDKITKEVEKLTEK